MKTKKNSFKSGQCVYFIQSKKIIREAKIIGMNMGLYTIQFMDTHGGIRVHGSKIYGTIDEAEKVVKQSQQEKNVSGKEHLYKPYW